MACTSPRSIGYVVPTLNSADTLDMTLYSLINQKDVNAEIIVVDSGSTDGTLGICEKWNIKTIYVEPGNMYRAINTGLRMMDTEWLGYINSDDYLYSDSLSRLITKGIEENADIMYGSCDYIDFQGRFLYSFFPPSPNHLTSIVKTGLVGFAQQTSIFRKKIYLELDGFQEEYLYCADLDFFARGIQGGKNFCFLSNPPVACFRIHSNQFSQSRQNEMNQESTKIAKLVTGEPNIIDRLISYNWRLKNFPYYCLRFLRTSLIVNKVIFKKTMSSIE